jgi:hypothetical protein
LGNNVITGLDEQRRPRHLAEREPGVKLPYAPIIRTRIKDVET